MSIMVYHEAAEFLLKKNFNNPMHYTKIAEEAIRQGLIVTDGFTPKQTMRSRMGERPEKFEKLGNGMYRLVDHDHDVSLKNKIEHHNNEEKEKYRKYLLNMYPQNFEKLVGKFLRSTGFDGVVVTQYRGDNGIDVYGNKIIRELADTMSIEISIQVKRWKNNVGAEVVRDIRGSLTNDGMKGLIITTSDFTKSARSEAIRSGAIKISLMNGKLFVNELINNGIGIRQDDYKIIEFIGVDGVNLDED